MIRLAIRELLSRKTATAVSAGGLLTAILGFLLLAGTARTTQTAISGDIQHAWATPYDLLVRPSGSKSALEEREGLVRPDFLQAIDGGITPKQLSDIRLISGVQVAAPISIIGAVQWAVLDDLDLSRWVDASPLTVLRVHRGSAGDAGLSTFPPEYDDYLYAAPNGRLVLDPTTGYHLLVGKASVDCVSSHTVAGVFCFGGLTPTTVLGAATPGIAGVAASVPQPAVIAAIDPVAEAQISPLGQCITSGRALTSGDAPTAGASTEPGTIAFPALVSDHTGIDETYNYTIERLDDPAPVLAGADPTKLTGWQTVGTLSGTSDGAYRSSLDRLAGSGFENSGFTPLWTIGDARYRPEGADHVAVIGSASDPKAYEIPSSQGLPVPGPAQDTWFRPVVKHDPVPRSRDFSTWAPVGRFDPACLSRIDSATGSIGLDAYAAPDARLPDGRSLGSSRSPGSYVPDPPLLLTTLDAAAWFAQSTHFDNGPGDAYIGAIRIKVDGVDEPTPAAQSRLVRIARDIHESTGLSVDIVKGVSAQQVSVDLPAGLFGRPALTLSEGWSLKGVAIRFAKALAGQDLALFAIVLLGAVVLVAETAFLSVRRRRSEFGVLRAIGWSRRHIAILVELEMTVLGVAVGLTAVLIGAGLALVTGSLATVAPLLAALPLGVGVVLIAGILPALDAGRGSTVRVLNRSDRIRRSGGPRTVGTFAIGDLFRARRVEAILGIAAVALGAALIGGILMVLAGFDGHLDSTILGLYVGAQVQPFHIVLAFLTMTIGTLAAAEIVAIGYLEREADFAVLRSLGWSRRSVAGTLGAQALTIGTLGGLLGAAVTAIFGAALGAPNGVILGAAGAGGLVALSATFLATIGPLVHAYRADPADALRGE